MQSNTRRLGIEAVKYIAGLPFRRQMAAVESLREDEFWDYQRVQLARQFAAAVEAVPYYQDRSRYPASLDLRGGVLAGLAGLPILSKPAVKAAIDDFERHPRGRFTATHTTGGTTGAPLRIRAGLPERGATNAILERRYLAITGKRYPRTLRLSGYLDRSAGDAVWQKIRGTRVGYLSIYHLDSKHKADILEVFRTFRPEALHGYASAHTQLAKLLAGEDTGVTELAIVSTSETLEPEQRDLIERQLPARVYNEYGSQEGQHLVLECSSRKMHIHPSRGVVEILRPESDEPAVAGELGRVVVTGLLAREMPLIRYDIGDSAISTGYAVGCPCGSDWPTIGQVYGRTEDLVKVRDGRRIGLLSHSTLKDIDGVIESQIIQRDFEDFVYKLVTSPLCDRAHLEAHVRQQLGYRLGFVPTVTFDYVSAIGRSPSGKQKAVVVRFQE